VGGEGSNNSKVHLGEREMRPAARGEGEKSSKAEDSDTKLRIIRRLNLLVSQPSICVCVYVWGGQYAIYNSNGRGFNTRV